MDANTARRHSVPLPGSRRGFWFAVLDVFCHCTVSPSPKGQLVDRKAATGSWVLLDILVLMYHVNRGGFSAVLSGVSDGWRDAGGLLGPAWVVFLLTSCRNSAGEPLRTAFEGRAKHLTAAILVVGNFFLRLLVVNGGENHRVEQRD